MLERRLAFAALVLLASCSRPPSSTTAPPASTVPAPTASAVPSHVAVAPAPIVPVALADPNDPLEIEAKAQWDAEEHVDIVYVPTPHKVVDKMLAVAKVTRGDVVYDLGCGDGRIVVAAAKLGATATGFDLDPLRVAEARAHLKAGGVESNAKVKWANVFSVSLEPATVVTLYLLPELNVRLIPQLDKLRPGSRIVSHDFAMQGVTPDEVITIRAPQFVNADGYSAYRGESVPEDRKNYKERTHRIYLWTAPLKKVAAPAH